MDHKIESGKVVQVTHGTDDVRGTIFIVTHQSGNGTYDDIYTHGYSLNPRYYKQIHNLTAV